MSKPRWLRCTLSVAIAATFCSVGTAEAASTALGPPFAIAVPPNAASAGDALGNLVFAWSVETADGLGRLIYVQRFNPAGGALGAPELVDAPDDTVLPAYSNLAVASSRSGAFAVVWDDCGSSLCDRVRVRARAFHADGSAAGAPVTAAAYDNGRSPGPDLPPALGFVDLGIGVAIDDAGDFAIGWEAQRKRLLLVNAEPYPSIAYYAYTSEIAARRYSAAGQPLTPEILVQPLAPESRSDSGNYAVAPSIASDASGNFVVAWQSRSLPAIYAQPVSAQGEKLGSRLRVDNGNRSLREIGAAVAMDAAGDFVVAWRGVQRPDLLSSQPEYVYARRYSASRVGGAVTKISTDRIISGPFSLSMNSSGETAISWTGIAATAGASTAREVGEQPLDAGGNLAGSNLVVAKDSATDFVHNGSVSVAGDGTFTVVFGSVNPSGPATFGQRYSAP